MPKDVHVFSNNLIFCCYIEHVTILHDEMSHDVLMNDVYALKCRCEEIMWVVATHGHIFVGIVEVLWA